MYKAVNNLKEQKGFTLIELLIVVAIIGILAAIAIPGYIGMQEKSRKGAIERSATSVVPEIQAWLQSSKGVADRTEIDTNFSGSVTQDGADLNNFDLSATGVDVQYVDGRSALNEKSPWDSGSALWVLGTDPNAATPANGRIVITSTSMGIRIIGYDNTGSALTNKIVTAD